MIFLCVHWLSLEPVKGEKWRRVGGKCGTFVPIMKVKKGTFIHSFRALEAEFSLILAQTLLGSESGIFT